MRTFYIIPVLVAAGALLLFFLIHSSERSLEFAADSIQSIDASGIQVSFFVCNPSTVPIILEGASGSLAGPQGDYGTLSIQARKVPTLSFTTTEGRAEFISPASMKAFIDSILSNQTSSNATLVVNEKILDLVPYSFTRDYRGSLSGLITGSVRWGCKGIPDHAAQIRQRLEVADAQVSAASLLYLDSRGAAGQSTAAGGTASIQGSG